MRASTITALAHCVALATATAQDNAGTFISAIGMGVDNRQRSTTFYKKAFGYKFLLNLPLDLPVGSWNEDILFNTDGGSAIVPMKWGDSRKTGNLPFKLQFACVAPQAALASVIKAGGTAASVDFKTESAPQAIYARDPDGYLLEILPLDKSSVKIEKAPSQCVLSSIGVGVSNLEKAAAFWSTALSLPAGPVKKYNEWSSVSFIPKKNSEFLLIDWNENPKRATDKLPYKIVLGTSEPAALVAQIKTGSGKITSDLVTFMNTQIALGVDPIDDNLIEINSV